MKLTVIPVTPFQQNCSLLVCEATGKAAVVDPGGDLDLILAAVREQGATLEKILLTHGHLDHCGGTHALSAEFGLTIEGPHRDEKLSKQTGAPALDPAAASRRPFRRGLPGRPRKCGAMR